MKRLYRYRQYTVWCFCALLCACCTACSSDQTIHDVDDHQDDVPMQFSQAAISTPVTRAASTALTQGFLVSCWKGVGTSKQHEVMGSYEVKYHHDSWNNVSTWSYVGSTADGFYKDQLQRYWDAEAFPYQFYAVTPCPAHADIPQYELTNTRFTMPESVAFVYQTCNNGVVTGGSEPCHVAQVEYNQVSSYVALPFRHLTSKVRFLIYNNYKKDIPADFKLSNIRIKVASDDFVIAGMGYTADMTAGDMLHGTFVETTKATDAEKVLLQTDDDESRKCNLKTAVDRSHAYDCMNPDGLLQMPQKNVRLSFSFDVYGVEFDRDFESEDKHIKYDQTTKTIYYRDVVIDGTFTWEPNTINTYVIKVNEFYPLSIDLSAELTPWTDIVGSIDANLEK